MAVDIKVAPDEKLELVQAYITDTNPNSDYFNISELPDTFSGGKNAFLIAGTDKLVSNSEIKIQIRDAAGKVCYIEYSNGAPEYYEGNSKVAAVYVYPTLTAFGPATITILGQLKDVPQEWNGLYSVKWQRQININPALANTTRVRFYKRPAVSITEIIEPLYTIVNGSKTPSLIQGSFASIKVNQLETFAGDVKRIKVYRTAEGDISDYDLIQDILVESKNLLTTYELSGSVVGNGGLFTNDSLSKLWLTSSLHSVLDSTYINDGLQLTGSGTFTYSASLNLLSSNTYELELDSYFTGSTISSGSNLGIYVSYPTQSLIGQPYTSTTTIAILSGSIPVKSFGTQTFPFNVPFDYATASLYLSQSSETTQWHVGNISLNVSQDTAFSPNEISFVTSMPTVLTNETFNFKFEFYDVNNNYVPVAVTQSALFVGGTNFNTLQSGSLYTSASLTALSQSVSGTISTTSASLQSSSLHISASLSSSISQSTYTSSLYTSASVSTLSGSVSSSINLVSGALSNSINVVSGSQYILSQSVSSSISSLSASISNSLSFISNSVSNSTFTVYSASAYLDKFIFTDENGKLNRTPATGSENGLFLGSTYLGYYSGSSWKTYMDGQGDFYLTGSNNNFLAWNSTLGTLQVQGVINIQGGNAATTSSLNSATQSLSQSAYGALASASSYSGSLATSISASNAAAVAYSASLMSSSLYISASLNSGISGSTFNATLWSASLASSSLFYSGALSARAEAISSSTAYTTNLLDGKIFTDSNGKVVKPPVVLVGSSQGLFLGSDHLGFYSGGVWKTYMDDHGKFYLTGSTSDGFSNYLTWDGAGGLTVAGNINIVGSNSNVYTQTEVNTISSSVSASAYRAYLSASAYSSSLSSSLSSVSSSLSSSAYGAFTSASSYSGSEASARLALSGSTATAISASNALAAAYSASISASTAATTALLDGKIFTDANGRIVKAPTASVAGLFLGSDHLGFYDSNGIWKTYMDNQGKFYLTGSVSNGYSNYLVWDGAGGLTIAGSINITGGNAPTTSSVAASINAATSSLSSSVATSVNSAQSTANTANNAATYALSNANTASIFTNSSGLVNKTPSASTSGLYLGSTYLGYYNGSAWKTYMADNGNFYLSGAGSDSLSWASGVLTINGAINITGGTAQTQITNAASSGSVYGAAAVASASAYATLAASSGSVYGAAAVASASAYANLAASSGSAALSYAVANNATASAVAAGQAAAAAAGAATYALSNANTASIFTSAAGAINKAASPSGAGLYLGSSYLGYYNGTDWKTYMANNGDFYLSGAGSNGLTWNSGTSTLSIDGNITARNGTFIGNITSTATISGGTITGGTITGGSINGGSFNGGSITIGNNFSVDNLGNLSANNANLSGIISASAGNIGGFTISNNILAASGSLLQIDTSLPQIAFFTASNSPAKIVFSPNKGLTDPAGLNTYIAGADFSGTYGTHTSTTSGVTGFANYQNVAVLAGAFGDTVDSDGTTPLAIPSGVSTIQVPIPTTSVTVSGGTLTTNSAYPNSIPSYPGQTYQSRAVAARVASCAWYVEVYNSAGTSLITSIQLNGASTSRQGATQNTYYYAPDGHSWLGPYYSNNASSYTGDIASGNYTATINIPTTAVYKVRVVLKLNAYAGYVYDNLLSSYTWYDTTATSVQNVYNTGFPYYNQFTFAPNVNKSEITGGGIQVVSDQYTYTAIYRNDVGSIYNGIQTFRNIGGSAIFKAYGDANGGGYQVDRNIAISAQGRGSFTGGLNVATSGDGTSNTLTDYTYFSVAYGNSSGANPNSIFGTNVMPYSHNSFTLGTSGTRWKQIWCQVGLSSTSDRNKKNSIEDTDLGLNFINKLRPVKYKLNEASTPRYHYGFIAQEVTASMAEFNLTTNDISLVASSSVNYTNEQIEEFKSGSSWSWYENEISASSKQSLSLTYTEFIAPMIKAIQELSDRVIYLESQLSGSI
jgi:hypothetical protein